MANLETNYAGIISPNPFWVASGPPTSTLGQARRAFEAGWGGFVWKTIGNPVVNVSSRYGALDYGSMKMMGFNNNELISDRGVSENLKDIRQIKKEFPKHTIIASLMVETKQEWETIVKRAVDAGADGLELNFGCPHGMCERGMGSAVGAEPEVLEELTHWVTEVSSVPVIAKLTPNITDILEPAMAAKKAKADGVSLINTIKSIIGVDLDNLIPLPKVGDAATNGGYCGPAVKPIALHMVGRLAREPKFGLPISGIGGIQNWKDAAEFLALGATNVQVCTAIMHYGFRIVEDMIRGLSNYLDSKNMQSVSELVGLAAPKFKEWGALDMNYKVIAEIDANKCIGCQLCYIACEDGAHQAITLPDAKLSRVPVVSEEDCVGCNLCSLVCPVPECITMVEQQQHLAKETWQEKIERGYQVSKDRVLI